MRHRQRGVSTIIVQSHALRTKANRGAALYGRRTGSAAGGERRAAAQIVSSNGRHVVSCPSGNGNAGGVVDAAAGTQRQRASADSGRTFVSVRAAKRERAGAAGGRLGQGQCAGGVFNGAVERGRGRSLRYRESHRAAAALHNASGASQARDGLAVAVQVERAFQSINTGSGGGS